MKMLFVADMFFLLFLAVSCGQQAEERRRKVIDDFQSYVRQHVDSVNEYMSVDWDSLQVQYDKKKAAVDKDTAKMAEDMRDTYYETIRDWDTFKSEYSINRDEMKNPDQFADLRESLTISGVKPDYSDLMAQNIVTEYKYFINEVRNNKDTFSKEQWLVVALSWRSLNGRKKEIQKEIPATDNSKILKLQKQYAGIRDQNRSLAAR